MGITLDRWLEIFVDSVVRVHEYWFPIRRKEADHVVNDHYAKVGGYDPYPCGSGKKLKHCCIN